MGSPTVALQMIVKDEYDQVYDLLSGAENEFGNRVRGAWPYFDEINLTVSDKATANKLRKNLPHPRFHVKWREWTDDFAAARNENFAMATTDYVFWLDADDQFDFSQIPKLVSLAEKGEYVVIYLPYNYAQDEAGRCVARHWRERLIKRSHPFEWRGRVHETYISDKPYKSTRVKSEVLHAGGAHHADSVERNHKILLKAAAETDDPRYLHYLGLSHYTRGENQQAINILSDFVKLSGWDEEIYRSYCIMAEAAYALDKVDLAKMYAMGAAAMMPSYPQAYWLMTQFEADQDNFAAGLEWAKVAINKPIPQSMSIVDPTNVSRTWLVGARCAYMLSDYKTAWEWIQQIPDEPLAQEFIPLFRESAEKEVFLKLLPTIRPYFATDNALWSALEESVKYDGRAMALRELAVEPKTWDDKSIVIFCGKSFEEWGPDTLDQGMGGSEEAIVYLSRELARMGWWVTVYNERDEGYRDIEPGRIRPGVDSLDQWGKLFKPVQYLPWRYFDKRDKFNVVVGWRTPGFVAPLDAKVKITDLHDIIPTVPDLPDVTYFVKSKFQRDLYPDLPDEKFKIVGNGICKDHFND